MSQSEIKAANDRDPTSTCDDKQVLDFDDTTLKSKEYLRLLTV